MAAQTSEAKTINQTVSAKAKAASSRAASSSASSSNALSSTNWGSVGYAFTKQQMQAKVAYDFSWKPVLSPSYDFETWFFHLKEHVNNLECTADIVDAGLSNLRKWLQEPRKPFVLKLLKFEDVVETTAKHNAIQVFFPPTRGGWIFPASPERCLTKRVYFHGGALSHLFSILSKGFCPAWVGTGGLESDGVCLSELPECAFGYPCGMLGGEWVASDCRGVALQVIYHVISLSETGGVPDSQKLQAPQKGNRQWASLDSTDLQIVAIEFIPQAQVHHLDEDFV